MKNSIYDMTAAFLERFYKEDPGTQEKQRIVADFRYLLLQGWTDDSIYAALRTFRNRSDGNTVPDLRMLLHGRPNKQNLIRPDVYYYHNQLRILPDAPKRIFDIDTGEILKTESEFFMEMRSSYTMNDLIDYYIRIFDIEREHRGQLAGAFRFVLKNHTVEEVLFMIDIAKDSLQSRDMDKRECTPFRLVDFRSQAIEYRNAKETSSKSSGSDKVVPKRRVLTFRGGDSVQAGSVQT